MKKPRVPLKNPVGVMQGRLLPKYQGRYQAHPVGYWHKEFHLASELGLDCIEFILDLNEADANPLLSEGGVEEIIELAGQTGVAVRTVCADYFMEAPLHHPVEEVASRSQNILERLLVNGHRLGLTDIVIPCVDQSSIIDQNTQELFLKKLLPSLDDAEEFGINLCLETDLPPQPFAELLHRFGSSKVTVNYDTGNSASLGYNPFEELACYGDRITDIHIKDRVRGGSSVLLGSGNTQFDAFFEALRPLRYTGPYIMQTYRDDEGVEVFEKQLNWFRTRFLGWKE